MIERFEPSFHDYFEIFDPLFFTSLENHAETTAEDFRSSLFYTKKYHVFPLITERHWLLAVVEIEYKKIKRDYKPFKVKVYTMNSLAESIRPNHALNVLKRFYTAKIKKDFEITLDKSAFKHINDDKALIQPNGNDCGPFCIFFICKFILKHNFKCAVNIPHNPEHIGPFFRTLIFRNKVMNKPQS